jgi:hypothetical protein
MGITSLVLALLLLPQRIEEGKMGKDAALLEAIDSVIKKSRSQVLLRKKSAREH